MANLKCYCDIFLEGLRKITQTSVRTAAIQTEIRTKCLPDKSQKWYRLRQLSYCRLSVKKSAFCLFSFRRKGSLSEKPLPGNSFYELREF